MPERIQLSRAKGWRIPRGTMKVDRSTAYGNPFRAGMYKGFTADDAVTLFRRWMAGELVMRSAGKPPDIGLLRGKNLACWCKPGAPCHADVLLELANTPAGVQGTATTAREDAKKARPPSDAEPWIVADDEGVRVTFRSEDAAWRYRNEYTDRLTNPTVTHEPATPGVPASAPLRTALDLTLTQGEAQNITAFLDDDAESDAEVVRLLIGDGHSGYGLYAAHPDYPGEGAMLVKNLPAPDGVKGPDHG